MSNALEYASGRHSMLPVYSPGKPIEDTAREYGLDAATICKLASNENPLGPSPLAVESGRKALSSIHRYPDGSCTLLKEALAERLACDTTNLVLGNGSNDVIELFAHAFIGPGDEAVMGAEAFPVYHIVTTLLGGTSVKVPMPGHRHDLDGMLGAITDRTRAVFLPSIDNPTGTQLSADEVYAFIDRLPEQVAVLFDEAYLEFRDEAIDMSTFRNKGAAVLATRTFSKVYGLAGLRVGYGLASAEMIALLNAVREPFNVNSIAQASALAALDDHEFLEESLEIVGKGRAQLEAGFESLSLSYVKSSGNFILVEVPDPSKAFDYLQQKGVIIRPIPSSPGHVRVSVGLESENSKAIEALAAYLKS